MSEYPKMERCIICRTELLWKEYKETHEADGFEVTLAVNFLTMLLSRFDGMYEEYAIEPPYAQLATELKNMLRLHIIPRTVARQRNSSCVIRNLFTISVMDLITFTLEIQKMMAI